jgi:hypothetical protein
MDATMLGRSLEDLSEAEPLSLVEDMDPDDETPLAERASATPLVRRLEAVRRRWGRGDLDAAGALGAARAAAPMGHHRLGVLTHDQVMAVVLGGACDAALLDLDESTPALLPGPEAHLISDHPLAAWWEAGERILYGDPLGEVAEGTALLLPLLYQYVVRAGEVCLERCVAPLHEEVREQAREGGRRPPSVREVRRRLATLAALLEELGMVTWAPEPSRLGTARRTLLGAFGWSLAVCAVKGPTPQMRDMLREHGYLEAGDGYVHRDDLPMAISDN